MIFFCLVLVFITIMFITTFHYKQNEYMYVSKKDHPLSFLYGTAFFILDLLNRTSRKESFISERERRTMDKLSKLYPEVNPTLLLKLHKAKLFSSSLIIIFFISIIGLILSLSDTDSNTPITTLPRPTDGEASSSVELNVDIDGSTTAIILEIESKAYTLEEAIAYFDSHLSSIEEAFLGDNKSLFEVDKDLNFISSYEGIDISWQAENYDYIEPSGHIIMSNIPAEGVPTIVYARLSYGGHEATVTFPIFITKLESTPSLKDTIISEINKNNDPYNSNLTLPDSINGSPLTFTMAESSDSSLPFF